MNWTEAELAAYYARQQRQTATVPLTVGPDTEAALRARLCRVSHAHGWQHYHTHDSRKSDSGWPDDVWCRPGELLVMELKIRPRKPTQEQLVWISLLSTVPGVEARVIYPGEDEYWLLARLQQPGKGR